MTEEKSFGELFPELASIYYIPDNLISMGVDSEDVKKYCLSKQRVRDVLSKTRIVRMGNEIPDLLEQIKKEPGLE